MGLMLEYAIPWNITGFPAGVMPVTTVKQSEQSFSDHYNDWWTKLIDKTTQDSQGLPICIQVVGNKFCDETALAVMKDI